MESKTRVLGWGTKISKPCCRIQDWNVCVGVSFFQTLRDDSDSHISAEMSVRGSKCVNQDRQMKTNETI